MKQDIATEGTMRAYERHTAVILMSVLLAFSVFVSYEKPSQDKKYDEDTVRVHAVGAVSECELIVSRGTTVEEVIKKVTIEKTADLSEIDGTRRIFRDETLVIPYVDKVTLFVTGAVEVPKLVLLNAGASPKDVLAEVLVRADANVKSFLRRKKLLTGSVVEIGKKRVRKQCETVHKNKRIVGK
jgi:hypothetical protein